MNSNLQTSTFSEWSDEDIGPASLGSHVPDVPDWFQRARNRHQKPPTREPGVPELETWAVVRSEVAAKQPSRNRSKLEVLLWTVSLSQLLILVPATLLFGYIAQHQQVKTARDAVVGTDAHAHRHVLVDNHNRDPESFENTLPALNNAAPKDSMPMKTVPKNTAQLVMSDASAANQASVTNVTQSLSQTPIPQPETASTCTIQRPGAAPLLSPGRSDVSIEKPLSAFALQSTSARDRFTEVSVPQNSWFTQGSAPECDSGTCKVVPISHSDRKFNTALQWETTPDEAAVKAAREGKLVFLIQVSGNFAQPGFT